MAMVSRDGALSFLLAGLAASARAQADADLPALVERLSDPSEAAAAHEQLTRLRERGVGPWLDAIRRDPAPLSAAIARARARLAQASPEAQAWFECEVASALVDFGLRKLAAAELRDQLGGDDRAVAKPARWLRAQALVMQAEIALLASDYPTAEAAAERARALADALEAEVRAKASPDRLAAALAPLQSLQADTLGLRARLFLQLGVLARADELVRAQQTAARASGDPIALDRACQVRALYLLAREQAGRAVQVVRDYRKTVVGRQPSAVLDGVELLAEVVAAASQPDGAPGAESRLRELAGRAALPVDLRVQAELACARASLTRGAVAEARAGIARARPLAAELGDSVIVGDVEALAARLVREQPAADGERDAQLERVRQCFDGLVDDWRRAPLREDGISFLASRARRTLVGELLALTLLPGDAAAKEGAVAELLRLQQLGSSAREQAVPAASAADVRDVLLGARDGVLMWQVSEAQTHVFALDRAGIVHAVQPGRHVAIPALEALAGALARVGVDGEDQAALGAELHELARAAGDVFLPAEIAARAATWQHVLVVDHGLPAGIPLECLAIAAHPDDLLGERWAIATLSSLPIGVHWQRTRYRQTPRATARLQLVTSLFGDESRPAGQRAPEFPRERAAAFGAAYASREVLRDREATPARVRGLAAATVWHFVAHGAEDRERTRRSGLALTPDDPPSGRGFFGSAEVEARAWSGLVILSACGVGRPMKRVGEESYLATLGGSFLRAGAHTVIQSAAELPFVPHLELCQRLHVGLGAGRSPAMALRDARAADRGKPWHVRFAQAMVGAQGLGHRAVIE